MEMSQAINELAAALAQAQAEMGAAVKDAANPFYKSKYADLASVRDACVPALTKHGLSVMQSPSADGAVVSVTTLLMHSSGQWVRGVASCTAKDDSPQAVGSATTYLRRYALQSFAGVAPEDDDGNGAQRRADAVTHEPVIQIRRDTKAEPAIPTQVTGRREGGVTDAPGTIGLPALSTREPGEDDELPPGTLLVTSIQYQATKNKNVQKALIGFSDLRVRSTINTAMQNMAEQCREARRPVVVEDKQTQWGFDLVRLTPQPEA